MRSSIPKAPFSPKRAGSDSLDRGPLTPSYRYRNGHSRCGDPVWNDCGQVGFDQAIRVRKSSPVDHPPRAFSTARRCAWSLLGIEGARIRRAGDHLRHLLLLFLVGTTSPASPDLKCSRSLLSELFLSFWNWFSSQAFLWSHSAVPQ